MDHPTNAERPATCAPAIDSFTDRDPTRKRNSSCARRHSTLSDDHRTSMGSRPKVAITPFPLTTTNRARGRPLRSDNGKRRGPHDGAGLVASYELLPLFLFLSFVRRLRWRGRGNRGERRLERLELGRPPLTGHVVRHRLQ